MIMRWAWWSNAVVVTGITKHLHESTNKQIKKQIEGRSHEKSAIKQRERNCAKSACKPVLLTYYFLEHPRYSNVSAMLSMQTKKTTKGSHAQLLVTFVVPNTFWTILQTLSCACLWLALHSSSEDWINTELFCTWPTEFSNPGKASAGKYRVRGWHWRMRQNQGECNVLINSRFCSLISLSNSENLQALATSLSQGCLEVKWVQKVRFQKATVSNVCMDFCCKAF